MRIECLPTKSPLRASKRLPGGGFKASRKAAASTIISFRRATLARFCRKTLRDHAVLKDQLGKFPLEASDHEQYVSRRDTTSYRTRFDKSGNLATQPPDSGSAPSGASRNDRATTTGRFPLTPCRRPC